MKAATLKWLVQGGQLYSAFPSSKDSLPSNIGKYKDGSKCQQPTKQEEKFLIS